MLYGTVISCVANDLNSKTGESSLRPGELKIQGVREDRLGPEGGRHFMLVAM